MVGGGGSKGPFSRFGGWDNILGDKGKCAENPKYSVTNYTRQATFRVDGFYNLENMI